MKIIKEIAILFPICFAGMALSALTPFPLPASLVSMAILLLLLATKIVKLEQIERLSNFFLKHMMIFFIPLSVGIIKNIQLVKSSLIQLLVVVMISTLLTFFTAYGVSALVSAALAKREGKKDA